MNQIKQLFFLLSILLLCNGVTQAAIPVGERWALKVLYNSTDGDNWSNNSNWMGATGSECTWWGVVCDPGETTVLEINLGSNNLVGSLTKELGAFGHLEVLNLSYNQLADKIPMQLGSLKKLRWLVLNNNQLYGDIPANLGDLHSLEVLYLQYNQLSGELPIYLENLRNVKAIHLDRNKLIGPLPAEWGRLADLQVLYLEHNQLSGSIPPQWGNLDNLLELDLLGNKLTGSIPPELGNLGHLQRLSLSGNLLTGAIPKELGYLANLEALYLNQNHLSGSIPARLDRLDNLVWLVLNNNNLTGGIPAALGDLDSLGALYLQQNRLAGSIPAELGNLDKLDILYLDSNQLSGPIPGSFINLTTLREAHLDLSYNALYTSDAALDAFLDGKQGGDWSATQTVAPFNVSASNITSNTLDLQWDPIEYTGHYGGYHVYFGTTPGGPYISDGGATSDKSANSLTITGLTPNTPYYFIAKTWTDPHSPQMNTVWSGHSNQVCVPAGAGDDVDCDGVPDSLDRDECVDTAMTIITDELYDGAGNTRLSSVVRIDTEADGTIVTQAPHLLILKAPEVVIRTGVTFRVEKGAELLIYSQPDACP